MKPRAMTGFLVWTVFIWATQAQSASDPTAILEQLQKSVPACALSCMLTEIPKSTCALTDFGCICTNTNLTTALVGCLSQSCTVIEQLVMPSSVHMQIPVSTTCGAPVRNIGHTVSIVMWIFFGLAALAVVCRAIARLPQLGGSFAWDDYTIFVCMLTLTPAAVCGQIMINKGLGQDIWMLSQGQITDMLHYFYVELYLYVLLVHFTKLSILLLYLRIFTSRGFQMKCYALIILTALAFFSSILVLPFVCRPLNFFWHGWDGTRQGKCININVETYTYAGINMVIDMMIFLLPISQVLHLHMNKRKKVGVIFVFAIGLFTTVCSIVRLPTALKWGKTINPTYDYARLAIWSLLEMMAGVICACFPGIASLLRRVSPKLLGTIKTSKYSGNSYDSASRSGHSPAPKQIFAKTTVVVDHVDRFHQNRNIHHGRNLEPDTHDARSDELELTPRTHYKQHENYTRYSSESDPYQTRDV